MGIVSNVSILLSVPILNANVSTSLMLGVHVMHITNVLHITLEYTVAPPKPIYAIFTCCYRLL
jgi:hypothetical protein